MALLAASVGGCATVPDPRFDYRCSGTAVAALNQAASVRLLDARGQLLAASTRWVRDDVSDMLDVHADWEGSPGPPTLPGATIRFHFHEVSFSASPGRLVLSTAAAQYEGRWSTGDLRAATINGRQLAALLRDDETILVALRNRSGALMGSTGIEAAAFAQGIKLVREADAMSRAASSDYRRRCQRQMRIART